MARRQFSAPSVLDDCKDMELTNGQERGHSVRGIMYSDAMELVEPTVVIKNGAFFYVPLVLYGYSSGGFFIFLPTFLLFFSPFTGSYVILLLYVVLPQFPPSLQVLRCDVKQQGKMRTVALFHMHSHH